MKRLLFILALLLCIVSANASELYYQTSEVNVQQDKQWKGWQDLELTIGYDATEKVLVLFTEEQQIYKLTYIKKSIEKNVSSYLYDAIDQNGENAHVVFSISSDKQKYITIAFPDFIIMYHVYDKKI